ncbi:uncharacterized protein LOC127123507 [Lathyrus oleraceus]|uniref:uncharacterized protein LOC127123507 n=1 Tax=Pisum sativum TaxID=3888 RepID=UPI0021D22E9E|nr:uncharacterized protein LOC127123507 [Pisum sativum]
MKIPAKKAISTNKDVVEEKDEGDTNKKTTTKGVANGIEQPTIKQDIPVSSSDPSYHPTSPKDSTKESIDEMDKPIEEKQKDHTSDYEHEDEKEKNAPVEEEVDVEMQNADEVVKDISEDGSPTIANPCTDGPDDEEEEDHSMSSLHMNPTEDENGEQDSEQENEQTDDMPKTNPTSDATKKTIAPSTRTIVALSPEELEALKQRKPVEYRKAIISTKGNSIEKSPSTSIVSGGQSISKSGDELLLKIKEKSFNIDLLQLLENEDTFCFGIKYLLKQVDVLNASPKVVDVIMI